MNRNLDLHSLRGIVTDSLAELGDNVARFLPNLAGALVLLLVGWAISALARWITRRVLRKVGLDRAADRTGVANALRRAGVEAPLSTLFAALLFWTLLLTFVLSAVEALGLTAVTVTIDRLIGFLPDLLAAALIVLFGLMLGRLVRNVVSSGAAAASLPRAQRVGAAAGGLVALVVFVLALEQLGVETALLVTVFTVLLATAGLTIGIAFALGARPLVTHILAGHFLRQSLPRGSTVEVRGQKGSVEEVRPLDTLLRDGSRLWSIPNAALMEETVRR